jgi:hypothetical protein
MKTIIEVQKPSITLLEACKRDGIKAVEAPLKEVARLIQMWPDCSFIAGESRETVYAVEVIDANMQAMVLYCIEVCN